MILTIKNLHKSFKQGATDIQVLKDFNLNISEGSRVAILGPSGSGKSTLLGLIAGLDKPDAGSILFLNQDITQLNEKELTQFRSDNISIIFQNFQLFPYLTALENVALPLELKNNKSAEKIAEEALISVGLAHRLHHFPHQLSGGECQRVAFARAFALSPKILLADEPSGSLDTKTGSQVMDLLFDLSRKNNTTLILVTHNEELTKKCDQVVWFK